MGQATRIRSTESDRETESWSRNRERLRRWRVRYWTVTGMWPDESARLTQTLAGWPRGHRGGWPRSAYRLADVEHTVYWVDSAGTVWSLVDRRNRNPTEAA